MSQTLTLSAPASRDLLPGYFVEPSSGAWLSLEPFPQGVPTIGHYVLGWCEEWLHSHLTGEPWRFTPGQTNFILWWYALRPDGRWLFRSGVKRGAKGVGKDPMLATLALAELCGPTRPVAKAGGWVGVEHRMALVQVAANSEAQAKDPLAVANAMVDREMAQHFGFDKGILRTQIENGSKIELLTSSEASSEGDPATAIFLNEALALDTPVPTPAGWTTMGDLAIGDLVCGADGLPTTVTKATETFESRACYRVTFADGDSVVADAGHLWQARPVSQSQPNRTSILTTEDIAAAPKRVRVPLTRPVECPEQCLPLDPYVLGAWLGDGSCNAVALSTSREDMAWWLEEFARLGYPARHRRTTASGEEITLAGEPHSWVQRGIGVRATLVELGIYATKRIPVEYLRGSVKQRLGLLQGLVDSDGCVDRNGRVIFVNTNEQMARGVAEIARSLGHIVQIGVRADERKSTYKPCWRVEWVGDAALPSARMPRKAQRLRPRSVSGSWMTVVSVEPVESVSVRCIAVDNDSHLFLVGDWKVTHNSHHMTHTSGGQRVAGVARRNVGKSPGGMARLAEFTNAHMPGEGSVAEDSYEAWQAQVAGKTRRQDILYDSREAPPHLSLHDEAQLMEGIAAAYADAPWVDLERIRDEAQDPRVPLADSIRYYFSSLPTSEDAWIDPRKFDALANGSAVEDGEQVALFLDCSKSTDATTFVGCRVSDGHVMALGGWQRPHGDRGKGWLAPRSDVDAAVRAAFARWDVAWFGVDPSPARDDEDEALYWAELVDAWHRDFRDTVLVWSQPGAKGNAVAFDMRLSIPGGRQRLRLFTEECELTAQAVDDDGSLSWDGDPMLRLHVHNARRRPNQWGVSIGKQSRGSSKLVDYAVSMVGARLGRRLVLNSGKERKRRSGRAMFV